MRRILLVALGLTLLLAQAVGAARPPADMEELLDRYFREHLEYHPETGSQLGLAPEMGYPLHPSRLDDGSLKADHREYKRWRTYRRWLDRFDAAELTPSQRRDAAVLRWYLDHARAGEELNEHPYVLQHLFNVYSGLTALLTEHHRLETPQDAQAYLARLRAIPERMEQAVQRVRSQDKLGIRPPGFILDRVVKDLEGLVETPPEKCGLITHLEEELAGMKGLEGSASEKLTAEASRIAAEGVIPGWKALLAEARLVRERADDHAGVWKLPRGGEYYAWCLKFHTTTDLTAEEIHQLGLREVAAIQKEVRAILAELGIQAEGSHAELMQKYWAFQREPEQGDRFRYPDTDEARARVRGDYQKIIDATWSRLPEVFERIPEARVGVEPVPPHRQAALGAYYQPAALDGSRPGAFFVHPGWLPGKPGMATLAHHEAVPGHHFQIALEQELEDVRIFKSLFFFTGFGEGWALYAERLAREQGWLPDRYAEVGYLGSSLFRAARLVIDTGLHHHRWTREQALEYMQENLGWSSGNEIDRYSVWPGQACAYKVGELKILELRERARKALGDRFDLRRFHSVVLGGGTMPLEILEQRVERYIREGG